MYLQQIRRECNRNCVSFSNLLSRFYQMPELSVKAGTLAWTDIPAFKNMVIKQVMAKLSQNVSCLFLLSYNVLQIILHGCSLIIGIYDIM